MWIGIGVQALVEMCDPESGFDEAVDDGLKGLPVLAWRLDATSARDPRRIRCLEQRALDVRQLDDVPLSVEVALTDSDDIGRRDVDRVKTTWPNDPRDLAKYGSAVRHEIQRVRLAHHIE